MCESNKLYLSIKGDKELDLSIDNPSENAKDLAVAQAFALFGVDSSVKVEVKEDKVEAAPVVTSQTTPPPTPAPSHKCQHNVVKTQATNMQEAVDEIDADKKPDYYKTGIKVKQGKNAYRCRYICPKCGNKGNHYVWEGTETCDCHSCQTSMKIHKSIKGVTLIKDKLGNFYVAGEQLSVLDLTYANQTEKLKVLKQHKLIDKDYQGTV